MVAFVHVCKWMKIVTPPDPLGLTRHPTCHPQTGCVRSAAQYTPTHHPSPSIHTGWVVASGNRTPNLTFNTSGSQADASICRYRRGPVQARLHHAAPQMPVGGRSRVRHEWGPQWRLRDAHQPEDDEGVNTLSGILLADHGARLWDYDAKMRRLPSPWKRCQESPDWTA